MAELYRREGSPYWYACIADPRRPGGYLRKSTKSTDERKARAYARDLQAQVDEGLAASLSKTGLCWVIAADIYLSSGKLSESTINNHASMIRVIAESCLGDFDLGSLDHDDITKFVQERRRTSVVPHNKPNAVSTKMVSDVTIRKYLNCMSATYRYVMDKRIEGAPKVNPFNDYDRRFLDNGIIMDRQLREDQFAVVHETLKNLEHQRILVTLVGTGMRAGELMSLTWPQVDLLDHYLHLGYEGEADTKSKKSRRLPLLSTVLDTLLDQRAHLISTGDYHPNGWVFPSTHRDAQGRRTMRRESLKYINKVVKEKTGFRSYTNHRLRHTFASWALQKDVDPITIRDLLGHSTLSTTTRYAHLITDAIADKFRRIDLLPNTQSVTQGVRLPLDRNKKAIRNKALET